MDTYICSYMLRADLDYSRLYLAMCIQFMLTALMDHGCFVQCVDMNTLMCMYLLNLQALHTIS